MKRLTERDEYGNVFCPRCLELCKGLPGSRFGENGKCSYCAVLEVLLFALAAYEDTGLTPEEIEELKKSAGAPQWISVKDRLPELIPCNAGTAYSEAVVTLTSGRTVVAAIYDGERFIGAFDYWNCEDTETVTHWIPATPLPKQPEDSDDIPEGATFA